MDLTDQIVSGTNEISLQDSLDAALLEIKVKMVTSTVAPSGNDMIIYVDKSSSSNPTTDRKQYVFNLNAPLKYFNLVGDEFLQIIKIANNAATVEALVNRAIGTNTAGDYVLDEVEAEELENIPITLFEGTNYIYTNYDNASITVIYPKDNDLNKMFLNNAIYFEHKINNVGEFSLDDIYFKDAFTKIESNLNLEVNNANIACLTSRNNKFSLDSEGNLTVNSITSAQGLNNNMDIFNQIYPVGSVYLSMSNTNPAILFGGTWSQISGYYLYAGIGGNTSGSNASGGPSADATGSTAITIEQMPWHTHTQNAHNHPQSPNTWMNDTNYRDTRISGTTGYFAGAGLTTYYTGSTTASNNYTGGGQGHTHTLSSHTHDVSPLRYEVYMWERTA